MREMAGFGRNPKFNRSDSNAAISWNVGKWPLAGVLVEQAVSVFRAALRVRACREPP